MKTREQEAKDMIAKHGSEAVEKGLLTVKKQEALAKFLGLPADDLTVEGESSFSHGAEYDVYTDDEADEAAKDYILDSLWAFRASFIAECMPERVDSDAIEAIQKMQEKLCESANPLIKAMIGDNIDYFVEHAISCDGRGHFLSSYDGKENEQDGFYIYRTN